MISHSQLKKHATTPFLTIYSDPQMNVLSAAGQDHVITKEITDSNFVELEN